jgi:hypothetical protein
MWVRGMPFWFLFQTVSIGLLMLEATLLVTQKRGLTLAIATSFRSYEQRRFNLSMLWL